MGLMIVVTMDARWTADGGGLSQLGQNQSNQPGFTATLAPGEVGSAQTLRLMVSEAVPGGDAPSSANFTTALNNAAADLVTMLSTPGAWGGNPGTPLSYIDAWDTAGP